MTWRLAPHLVLSADHCLTLLRLAPRRYLTEHAYLRQNGVQYILCKVTSGGFKDSRIDEPYILGYISQASAV